MTDYTIDPRQTVYAGVLFKSRLEADVASDLDAAGIDWLYEPRTYVCRCHGRRYRPDFEIGGGIWEVKPTVAMALEAIETNRMHPVIANDPEARMAIIWPSEWDGDRYLGWYAACWWHGDWHVSKDGRWYVVDPPTIIPEFLIEGDET